MSVFSMFGSAFRGMLQRPATRRYPKYIRPQFEGARGKLVIDGPACIFCGACSRRCPTHAIGVSKEAQTWSVDRLQCVICGCCVGVCPKKCLALENERQTAVSMGEVMSATEEYRRA